MYIMGKEMCSCECICRNVYYVQGNVFRVSNPNVTFTGFLPNALEELAQADLLVHLCPVEPFGLTILEAMAAGVPVLVPDSGGAGSVVQNGISGFRFRSNDADSLGGRLVELTQTPAECLNRIVAGGREALVSRFSAEARLADYRSGHGRGKLMKNILGIPKISVVIIGRMKESV